MRRFLLTKPLTVLLSLLCAATLSPVFVVAAHAAALQSELKVISGQGEGDVLVSPTAENKPTFAVEIQVNVQHMLPNSNFMVERRVDTPPDSILGDCTSTTLIFTGYITTLANGAGAEHFEVERGMPFNSGVSFDVQFLVIGIGNNTELQSECMTVTVK